MIKTKAFFCFKQQDNANKFQPITKNLIVNVITTQIKIIISLAPMKVEVHQNEGVKIAEIISDAIILTNAEEGLQLRASVLQSSLVYLAFLEVILPCKMRPCV